MDRTAGVQMARQQRGGLIRRLLGAVHLEEPCPHSCCPPGHGPWLRHLVPPSMCSECKRVAA